MEIKAVSWKAPLVVLWAVLIAGTTVASENHRLCEMNTHADVTTIAEFEVLIVEEVSETN
jgi:hypothetical protein